MILFSISEIIDIIVMVFAIGFIFHDILPARQVKHSSSAEYDPIAHYTQMQPKYSKFLGTWDQWKFSIIAIAPSIIIHEIGHKFVALYFGLSATFNAAYGFLAVGIVLKLLQFPFIFLVPAYVSIVGNATALQSVLISFSGPVVHLIIWLACKYYFSKQRYSLRTTQLIFVTQKLNGFLFIFNMLPIPGFDGFSVYMNLIHMFF